MKLLSTMVVFMGGLLTGTVAHSQVNDAAAQAVLKKSNCFKCHSVDKKKDGPPYREIAGKYKDKPDAEATLYKHVTTTPKIKVDGEEEEHRPIKSDNEAEIRNVVKWIMSR
jgi:cytochrome c